jgi:hypothetical protein
MQQQMYVRHILLSSSGGAFTILFQLFTFFAGSGDRPGGRGFQLRGEYSGKSIL